MKRRYEKVAVSGTSCCGAQTLAEAGYGKDELDRLPPEALVGLGCGDPVQVAGIQEGQTVVDLGSGGGLHVLLAARLVGPSGRVVGIDMTPAMLERARRNAARLGLDNVEFREGMIEALPVADASVDVILSNCVINLAPDKRAVFGEAFRVLKPGGHLVVSDVVARGELPPEIRENAEAWASCVAGALPEHAYVSAIREAGFETVDVVGRPTPGTELVYSVTVRADKARAPAGCCG